MRLAPDDVEALRRAVAALAVRTRTGDLGRLHGLERFVSAQAISERAEPEALDAAARKLGVGAGVRRTTK